MWVYLAGYMTVQKLCYSHRRLGDGEHKGIHPVCHVSLALQCDKFLSFEDAVELVL